jgi:lysophospholipase L1-like esterase
MRPFKITIYIWSTIAILAILCLLVPKNGWNIAGWNLHWPTIEEILNNEAKSPKEETIGDDSWYSLLDDFDEEENKLYEYSTIVLSDSLATTDSASTTTEQIKKPIEIDPSKVDSRNFLASFYQALDSAHIMTVRVVHYGDSQIEEDRITSILREMWQSQYGGGGVGLIPLHQTIPTVSLRQSISINGATQSTQGGPKRYLAYGPSSMRLNSGHYGVMGQVAVMDNNLVSGSQNITMNISPFSSPYKSYNYFNRIRIVADNISANVTKPQNSTISSNTPHYTIVQVPDNTTHCTIELVGQGNVYGISLETPTGIIVDNIPMRGSSGNIFSKIEQTALTNFYQETNTRLIILQYGGNMIPGTTSQSGLKSYMETLRKQIRHIRACAPFASILFIGPSDMSKRVDGEMETYPLVPVMDHLLAKLAEQEHIAYWSLFKAMGGEGSMVQWKNQGLAGSDYVHFTRAGANKAGKMLYEWLDWKPDNGFIDFEVPNYEQTITLPTTILEPANTAPLITDTIIPTQTDTIDVNLPKDTIVPIVNDTIPTEVPIKIASDTITTTIIPNDSSEIETIIDSLAIDSLTTPIPNDSISK